MPWGRTSADRSRPSRSRSACGGSCAARSTRCSSGSRSVGCSVPSLRARSIHACAWYSAECSFVYESRIAALGLAGGRAAARRTRHPCRPASTRSRRPRLRRSATGWSRRASHGRPPRRPSCRRTPGRAPSRSRSRPCATAAWRWWCAAPDRRPGRSSRRRGRAACRCRPRPRGRGGRRGRSCACAARSPAPGRSGSRSPVAMPRTSAARREPTCWATARIGGMLSPGCEYSAARNVSW